MNNILDFNSFINESKDNKVFLFLGRFQPFHMGHLKAMQDLQKHFKCPGVIALMYTAKEKGKSPFSQDLLLAELKELTKHEKKLVLDYTIADQGLIPVIVKKFQNKGFDVIGAGCGEDRIDSYQRQVDYMTGPKSDTPVTPDFELVLTNRYGSATDVRNSIKNDDFNTFKKLMPKYLHSFYDEFKSQINK